MVYVSVAIGLLVFIFSIVAFRRGWWSVLHRRIVGWAVISYGVYLATLTGSYLSLALPGVGAIAIGAGAGAAVGFASWLVIGTVGVATGGVGVAIGVGAMSVIGAIFGGAGGAAGGFGISTVTYPLVSPFLWVPVIIIGIYFLIGKRIKSQGMLPGPTPERNDG
jgi:hypothetical protein